MEAHNKCPNLVVVPPDYKLYNRSSIAMVELLSQYTDHIERYSIDEVFIDATNAYTKLTDPIDLADEMRNRIRDELGFSVCVGVSNNKLLAKMATDLRKPDFTNILYHGEIEKKIWPLPVDNLFMVGRQTANKLNKIGIRTIGQLAKADKELIEGMLKSHGRMVWNYANGIDVSLVKKEAPAPKGLGNSTTIAHDVYNIEEANMVLLSLSESVGMRLRNRNLSGYVVSVHIKFTNFESISKQKKQDSPINSTNLIYEEGRKLLKAIWKENKGIRQIGISISDVIINDNQQLTLFEDGNLSKYKKIDKTIDNIRDRYGKFSVHRACFLGTEHKPIQGGVEDDHFMMNSHL